MRLVPHQEAGFQEGETTIGSSPLDQLIGAMVGRRISGFRVLVRADGLVLRGRAPSYHAKQLAQHLAMSVTDLPIAANEIEVFRRRPRAHPGLEEGGTDRCDGWVLLATADEGLQSIGRRLTDHGYAVIVATGGIECLVNLQTFVPDVILLDAGLLWGGAEGVIDLLRESPTAVPVVLLVAPGAAPPTALREQSQPVVAAIETPRTPEGFLEAVRLGTGGARAN